jgi:hypothetical protein
MHHPSVPNAIGSSQIGRVQNRLYFVDTQVTYEPRVSSLTGNGENATALFEDGGHAVLNKTHKRLYRCQAGIACESAVAPRGLQVFEEIHNHAGVQLLYVQLRRNDAGASASVFEEKTKCVGVSATSMGAGPALNRKPFPQKRCDMGSNERHQPCPFKKV